MYVVAFATRQHARGLKIRQLLLGQLLLVATILGSFFHDDRAHCHKDEVEDQQLRTLAIGRADISRASHPVHLAGTPPPRPLR